MKKIFTPLLFVSALIYSNNLKAQIKLDTSFNCTIPKLSSCITCLPYAVELCQLQDKSVITKINYIAVQAPFKTSDYLLKFNDKGVINNTFGNNGKLDIKPLDKIFADGNDFYIFSDSNRSNTISIKKFNVNGSIVTSWCNNGVFKKVSLNNSLSIDNLFVSNGSVFAAYTILLNGGFNTEIAISKIKNNTLDASFGNNGTKTLFLDSFAKINKIIERKNGKILLAVFANYKIRIVQLNTDGSLDTQFGKNGILYPSADFDTETPKDIVEDNNGNIFLLADFLKNGNEGEIFIAKYSTKGSPITDFGSIGKIAFSCENKSFDFASNLMLQSDGTIIALSTYENNNKALFNHFNSIGQALTSFNLNANTNLVNNSIFSSKTNNSVYVFGNGIQKYTFNGNSSTNILNTNIKNSFINIYPNPTTSILNISLPIETEKATIIITDAMGKIVLTDIISQSKVFNLTSLSAGIYTVNIVTETETKNIKLMKQ